MQIQNSDMARPPVQTVQRAVSAVWRAPDLRCRQMSVFVEDILTGQMRWSAGALALLGLCEQDAPRLSELLPRLLPCGDCTGQAAVAEALSGARPLDAVLAFADPGGALRHVHVRATALRDACGTVVRLSGSVEDVTDVVNADAELEAARCEIVASQRRAAEAQSSKSRFLAVMSHEIRTPLNAILGAIALLKHAGLDDEGSQLIHIAERSGEHLLALLNDLLDLSRIEAGALVLSQTACTPGDIIRSAAEAAGLHARDKGLTLAFAAKGDISARGFGDPTRLRQVAANIIENAVKFTAQGGVRVTLSLRPAPDGQLALTLRVDDSGPGFPEDAERLFQPFEQGDGSITRAHEGAGLGLAICRRLARAMGGDVTVGRSPDGGACVIATVTLAAAPAEAGLVGDGGTGLRILVAEDHPANQALIRLLLSKMGHVPVIAENGLTALEAFDSDHFDLVLMDLHMPVMDGFEAARAIRGRHDRRASVPIIALTADVRDGVREEALSAGMNAYLAKPLNVRELAAEIARWARCEDAPQSLNRRACTR